jgi:hypothetical protein
MGGSEEKEKVNDMERNVLENVEHQKFPSFHEVLGAILAGFIDILSWKIKFFSHHFFLCCSLSSFWTLAGMRCTWQKS